MTRPRLAKKVLLSGAVALVLACTMGQSCVIIPIGPQPVTVEMTNLTGNQVQALLWSDPGILSVPDDIMLTPPYNLGPPLNPATATTPAETVTITISCADAGTLVADGNLILVPTGSIPSANILLLQEGRDFLCGDTVSFFYEVTTEGEFFTSVDVNGVYLAP